MLVLDRRQHRSQAADFGDISRQKNRHTAHRNRNERARRHAAAIAAPSCISGNRPQISIDRGLRAAGSFLQDFPAFGARNSQGHLPGCFQAATELNRTFGLRRDPGAIAGMVPCEIDQRTSRIDTGCRQFARFSDLQRFVGLHLPESTIVHLQASLRAPFRLRIFFGSTLHWWLGRPAWIETAASLYSLQS